MYFIYLKINKKTLRIREKEFIDTFQKFFKNNVLYKKQVEVWQKLKKTFFDILYESLNIFLKENNIYNVFYLYFYYLMIKSYYFY